MVANGPRPTSSKKERENAYRGTQWLTVEEAARELERTTRTVGRMLKQGILTRLPGGRRVRIPCEDVEKIIRRPIAAAVSPVVALNVEQYVAFRLEQKEKKDLLQDAQAKLLHVEREMKAKDVKIRSLERDLKKAKFDRVQAVKSIADDMVKSLLARFFERNGDVIPLCKK